MECFTYLLIKNEALCHAASVIAVLQKHGFRGFATMENTMKEETVRQLYMEHDGRPFFEPLVRHLSDIPVAIILMHRPEGNAVKKLREVMGATDPSKAERGTLRRAFGKDFEHNGFHAPDSEEAMKRECGVLKIPRDWYKSVHCHCKK